MEYGEHRVPDPIKDEDRWVGLTKTQWITLAPFALVIIAVWRISYGLSILPVGIFLSVIIGALAYGFVAIEVPPDKYLMGSGNKFSKLTLRYVIKKMPWRRKTYTKNLDNGFERWKEK